MKKHKVKVLKPEIRADQILSACIRIIKDHGWNALSRDIIADEAECAAGTVNHVFGTMHFLREEVMKRVVLLVESGDHCDELLMVIASGLARGDVNAKKAPKLVKDLAITVMMGSN